jgi:hypothetical protein
VSKDQDFEDPAGVAQDAGGVVLVADPQDDKAGHLFSIDTTVEGPDQVLLSSAGLLVDPTGVAIEPSGDLVVAERDLVAGVGRVVRLSRSGGQAPPLPQSTLVAGGRLTRPVALAVPPDADADDVQDGLDNCAAAPNAGQADRDGDGVGDACDPDDDGDGVSDGGDNCASVANPGQTDADADGVGDACESDTDGDAVTDAGDNCVSVANAGQADLDGDGQGDACDADDDADGHADGQDSCATVANADQADTDGDGDGDACDPDDDGDGIGDAGDNCVLAANADQVDADGDGFGAACDGDDRASLPRATPDDDASTDTAGADAPAPVTPEGATPAPAFTVPAFPLFFGAPPAPSFGRAVALSGVRGRVSVRRAGRTSSVPLTGAARIPVGSVVDTTSGAVVLTSATKDGRVQSATFAGGAFTVRQPRAAGGRTDLVLAGQRPRCGARSSAVRTRKRPRARLWGDGRGRFRTHGRNAIASVRGTKWLVEETCRGTLVRVTRGVVDVRDRRRGRTIVLRRGGRYLARG